MLKKPKKSPLVEGVALKGDKWQHYRSKAARAMKKGK